MWALTPRSWQYFHRVVKRVEIFGVSARVKVLCAEVYCVGTRTHGGLKLFAPSHGASISVIFLLLPAAENGLCRHGAKHLCMRLQASSFSHIRSRWNPLSLRRRSAAPFLRKPCRYLPRKRRICCRFSAPWEVTAGESCHKFLKERFAPKGTPSFLETAFAKALRDCIPCRKFPFGHGNAGYKVGEGKPEAE